jgi:glycosyltransferase involved in cell wall biosynthesis
MSPQPLLARRVLMLCYLYPPLLTSGVNRSVGFAEHLRQLGYEPTVLTVREPRERWAARGEHAPASVPVVRSYEWNLDACVEAAQGVLSRAAALVGHDLRANYVRDRLCIPDSHIAWFSTLPGLGLARGADVIYVSCSPFSSALSGVWLRRLTGRPLVVDFRDAWSLNPHNHPPGIHSAIVRRLERLVIGSSDAVILNTPGAKRLYVRAYPEHADRFHMIPNGYDELPAPAPTPASDRLVLLHVGSFYGTRTPDRLLQCLSDIGAGDVAFWHVGPPHPSFDAWRDRVRIRTLPAVPHAEVLSLLRQASLLYLKQGTEPGVSDYIAVAAKTYEYLTTGLPILAECPEGDNAELVRHYCRHPFVVTDPSIAALKAHLSAALELCRRQRPQMQAPPPEFVERFSRRRLAQDLAAVLEAAVARRTAARPSNADAAAPAAHSSISCDSGH